MNNKFTFSVAGLVKDNGFSRRPEATYIRRESKDLSEAVAIASNPLTARLIVRKVNAYDVLLEACKAACRASADCLPPTGEGELDAVYYKAKLLAIDKAASQCSEAILQAEGDPL